MTAHEKEALQPFLAGDDGDSRDSSLELPELNDKSGYSQENFNEPRLGSPSEELGVEDGARLGEQTPLKKSATYAIAFMLGAQVFSASMNVSIRLLENASTHLHPLQVSPTFSKDENS